MRRLIYSAFKFYWKTVQPLTLGSRAIVIEDGKVLLVRLTYTDGWYLPGGAVEKNESFSAGVVRELREECGIEAHQAELFGLYFTRASGKHDHVAIFVVKEFERLRSHSGDKEIAEMKFFDLNGLPEDVSPATGRRIREYLGLAGKTDRW